MSNHWYESDGTPLYEVFKAGSKEKRPTTLADAKKLKLLPSVTTITSIMAKPAVDTWKLNIAMEHAKNLSQFQDRDQWKNAVLAKAKNDWEAASKRGTEIHDKLENYFQKGLIDIKDEKFIVPALNMLGYEFNGQKWISEDSFGHREGFGGKIDLYSKAGIILDFKTKAKDIVDRKSLYFDYCIQLAAYRLGLDLPKAKCYNLIISTTKPGTLYLHRWSEEDLQKGLRTFRLMLSLWKEINNYDSSRSIE